MPSKPLFCFVGPSGLSLKSGLEENLILFAHSVARDIRAVGKVQAAYKVKGMGKALARMRIWRMKLIPQMNVNKRR